MPDGVDDDPVVALGAQQDELAGLVAAADGSALDRPSRCPGWSVADVLLHLAQTNEMAVASVEGRLDRYVAEVATSVEPDSSVDDLAAQLVAAERGDPLAARDRWLASAAAQRAAFESVAPGERVRWVAGELAARSLATTRLSETWIHTVDVAVALGPEPPPTGRLWHVARLVWRTLPYAFTRAGLAPPGPVRFELDAPGGGTWLVGDDPADTVVRGTALDLCTVAGQRADASGTGLRATGPAADDVLTLMRTFA